MMYAPVAPLEALFLDWLRHGTPVAPTLVAPGVWQLEPSDALPCSQFDPAQMDASLSSAIRRDWCFTLKGNF